MTREEAIRIFEDYFYWVLPDLAEDEEKALRMILELVKEESL